MSTNSEWAPLNEKMKPRPSQVEELALAGGVELQQRGPELKALRPFRPSSRLVAALDGENRRALLGPPCVLDRLNLLT